MRRRWSQAAAHRCWTWPCCAAPPGYASGLAIGTIYFLGFTGIFLIISVALQEQFGLSPLQAGLLVTPFAAGSAVASPIAGRLVARIGRKVTVFALIVMLSGTGLLIVMVPDGSSGRWVLFSAALLVAGLGGGGVISPNFTLTLENVPTRMAGAAGGALQTGQRIGTAIGTALLMSAYRNALERGAEPQLSMRLALTLAFVLLSSAFLLAVRDLRVR